MNAGTQIAHYKFISALGKGGMGEVYLADDTKLDRQVGIKMLPDAVRQDPERLARFRREAKAAASCVRWQHDGRGGVYAWGLPAKHREGFVFGLHGRRRESGRQLRCLSRWSAVRDRAAGGCG